MEKYSRGGVNMVIMCDVDGILNDLVPKTLEMYNKQSGKNFTIDDINQYNFYDCLSKEDADGIVALFKDKSLWDSLKPLPGSQEGVRKLLEKGHKIYLATATAPYNFEWKISWLEHFFPFINTNNVIRIIDKSLLNADILIDDCLDHLTKNICHRICLEWPWNHDKHKDYIYDIHRCYSWDDIVIAVNKIEKEMKRYE
jgi:5'(3')-deoxyribonucleotidase